MTTFNFRGLPDCFVRMIRFFVLIQTHTQSRAVADDDVDSDGDGGDGDGGDDGVKPKTQIVVLQPLR